MSDAAEQFHRDYYDSRVWQHTSWLGVPCYKTPLDLWVYQEIVWETRPDLVIECGTAHGGTALFLAHLLDLLGRGHVVTIDREYLPRPAHARVRYLEGRSSTDPSVVAEVAAAAAGSASTLVLLDSEHAQAHVLEELRLYHPFVTLGNYLIVEDTNVNGHPVLPDFGPGPAEAVREFLAAHDDFVADRTREKFLLTFNPGGFLKRVKRPAHSS